MADQSINADRVARHPQSIALDMWIEKNPEMLNHHTLGETDYYLTNRLKRAFCDGWGACEEHMRAFPATNDGGQRVGLARAQDVWTAIMQDETAGFLMALMLGVAAMIDRELLARGRARIMHEEAIGPLVNPTAYLDGTRFNRMREYAEILSLVRELKGAIEKCESVPPSIDCQVPVPGGTMIKVEFPSAEHDSES